MHCQRCVGNMDTLEEEGREEGKEEGGREGGGRKRGGRVRERNGAGEMVERGES